MITIICMQLLRSEIDVEEHLSYRSWIRQTSTCDTKSLYTEHMSSPSSFPYSVSPPSGISRAFNRLGATRIPKDRSKRESNVAVSQYLTHSMDASDMFFCMKVALTIRIQSHRKTRPPFLISHAILSIKIFRRCDQSLKTI